MTTPKKPLKKILIVGNWYWDIYEDAFANGFKHHHWQVTPFIISHPSGKILSQLSRLRPSGLYVKLNTDLLQVFYKLKPDIVFLVRPDIVLAKTIKKIKKDLPSCVVMSYHNDNPFKQWIRRFSWRHFLAGLKFADTTIVYRPSDIDYAVKYGAKRTDTLLPSFLRHRHIPTPGGPANDIIFIGHFENDGRDKILDYLYQQGLEVTIFGTGWEKTQRKYQWMTSQKITRIWGEKYTQLLSSAKFSLVFLSHRNQDVYTRRCFEIPACGSLMLAPRTKELEKLFKNNQEAIFWESKEDLAEKIKYYMNNEKERQAIAKAGRIRLLKDGHDEFSRTQQLINIYNEITLQK